MPRVVPMLHVPDVEATARWYAVLGFEIVDTAEDEEEMVWASLRFGESEVMLNTGGAPSDAERREVDLYCFVEDIEAMRRRVQGHAELVEELHDSFYGMREFIVRDCNRFWITFGQPLPRN